MTEGGKKQHKLPPLWLCPKAPEETDPFFFSPLRVNSLLQSPIRILPQCLATNFLWRNFVIFWSCYKQLSNIFCIRGLWKYIIKKTQTTQLFSRLLFFPHLSFEKTVFRTAIPIHIHFSVKVIHMNFCHHKFCSEWVWTEFHKAEKDITLNFK